MASEFTNFSLNQIPREYDAEADALVNLGSSIGILLETNIPIVHITIPVIEYLTKIAEDLTTHNQIPNIIETEDLDLPHRDPNV